MDKKLIQARADDLFDMCERRGTAVFSAFLDGGEAAFIDDVFHISRSENAMLFGGYNGAERKMLGVFPEWEEKDGASFPITVIRFDAPKFRTLTHRDYLGTLMSLGIERNKTGDILTDDTGAYVMVESGISDYILNNINKIANTGVKGRVISAADFVPPKPETQEKQCVAASERLDAVIAAVYGISRAQSEKLVKGGAVKVNHRETLSGSALLNEGDLVSVRGMGRFTFKSADGATMKGRLHITVLKYI